MRHPATSRLYHKDDRQRRRAIRKLFEVNDSDNLYDFVNLLDDKEPWFRERAMEAAMKWSGKNDKKIVRKLAKSKYFSQRLLASKLATRLIEEREEILEKLSFDSDIRVRISSWKEKLDVLDKDIGNLIDIGISSKDKSIRKISMIRVSKMEVINPVNLKISLEDKSSSVRYIGLEIIKNNPEINKSGKFDNYLLDIIFNKKGKEKNMAASILIERDSDSIEDLILGWTKDEDIGFIISIVGSLRKIPWWNNTKLASYIISESSDTFVTKILRFSDSKKVTEIRNKILIESSRSEDLKAIVIQDLIGRKIDLSTQKIMFEICEGEESLLTMACKQVLNEL